MFASLGFKVDTSGLDKFKRSLSAARGEMTNISRGTKTATRQLRGFKREVNNVSKALDKIKGAGASRNVGKTYDNIASSAKRLNTALDQIATNRGRYTKAIGKINSSVAAGAPIWERYRESVVRTRRALHNINGELNRLRNNSRVDIRVNRRDTGGGGSGGGRGGSGGFGSGFGAFGAGMGMRGFLANMIPAMALGGGGAMLGFGGKAVVEAARDQTRMESMLLMTAKSGEEFARTLSYVRGEAARLGLSSTELGKSFAQINMSARGLDQETKEKMFTGFSEFMMSMGTSADDQKGIFRAFNQMFSNNRILQEEINQLSERGIPATLVYDAAMKAYDTKNIQQIKKLQEDGKLDPKRVLPIMAKMVQDLAHDSGSYAKMMESSIVKQGKFYEQLRQTSKKIMDGGLDVYLGKVFGILTKVVVKVEEFAVVLKATFTQLSKFRDFINEITGGNKLLQLAIFITLFRLKSFAKGIAFASRSLARNGSVLRALAHVLTGVFGRALGAIVLRMGVFGVAIYAASEAISFLYGELQKGEMGDWSFFDDVALKIEYAILQVKLLVAEIMWFKTLVTSGALMNASMADLGNLGKRSVLDTVASKKPMAMAITSGIMGYQQLKKLAGMDTPKGSGKDLNVPNSPLLPDRSQSYANSMPKSIMANIYIDGDLKDQQQAPFFMLNR